MDNARVKRLAAEWLPKTFDGWALTQFINAGKTALVFRAAKNDAIAAVKIFDPEMVEKYGRTEVEGRLHRELALVGKHHEHLVKILSGGHVDSDDLYFIVMEYVEGPNLASAIKEIPIDSVRIIISQVAAAAHFLEDQTIVHRDIKPDNIAVLQDFKRAVLLDLGVIRPFSEDTTVPLTDREEQLFIGTHRYSPPEFILRKERQTPEGFRAVTFYQLGAVLHDLLVKQRLFHDSASPLARLIQSVLHDIPKIDPTGKPPDLVALANNCLVKDPDIRLQIVSWNDFQSAHGTTEIGTAAKDRIRRRRLRAIYEQAGAGPAGDYEETLRRRQTLEQVSSRLAELVRATCSENDLPPRLVRQSPEPNGDESRLCVIFKASAAFALPIDFYFMLRVLLLDLSAQVVSIECACAVSRSELGESGPVEQWSKVFSGVYEDSSVRLAIETALFPAFEMALDMADVTETKWVALPNLAEQK